MKEKDLLELLRSQILENMSVNSLNGGFLVRLPFSDCMGDPIEMSVIPAPGGLILDDLGHTAGLLFDLAQHGEDAPGHLLIKNLAEAYGLTMDYDCGILSQRVSLVTDSSKILDFVKVLVSVQTTMSEMQRRKRAGRREKRLRTRLGQEIQLLLLPKHVQRDVEVAGKHETWVIDYKYIHRKGEEAVDILIVTTDLRLREPRQKAEHVLTLAIDILEMQRKPDLRVVYDIDGNGTASAAQRAADLIVDYQHRIGYRAYNYTDSEQKANLRALTLQELSPILVQSGIGGSH